MVEIHHKKKQQKLSGHDAGTSLSPTKHKPHNNNTSNKDLLLLNRRQLFDIILTREHCVIDRQVRVAWRNKDIFLDGRSMKNVLFLSNEVQDACNVH